MNNEEKQLNALTNQTVTITLGGRQYQAKRASLYDMSLMTKKRKELQDTGDIANLDTDVALYTLFQLIKDNNPGFGLETPEDLAKSIPFEAFQDVMIALEAVGFKVPQTLKTNQEQSATGAQPTQ